MNAGRAWRSLRAAAWLGWQIESNWTDPFLFTVYSVAKPVAAAAILVVMYAVATRGDFSSPTFAYIYLGSALYVYVGAVMTGVAFAVIDDRERYRMLRYVYVAPIDFRLYLIGRAVGRFAAATASVLITLAAGIVFFHLDIHPGAIDWPVLVLAMAIGMPMLALLGLGLGGVVMQFAQQSWSVGDAVAGTLFLISGAVFPLDILPAPLRACGFVLPITYWLELVRRALVGRTGFQTFATVGSGKLLVIFSGLTCLLAVAVVASFRWCEQRARERGLLDRTTNY